MSGLCLAAGAATARLAVAAFTLAWTHTVEKVEWREHWRVAGTELVLDEASVVGSGAGMEPPPEARLIDGRWTWRPQVRLAEVVLRRAPEAGDWRLCVDDRCRPLGEIVDGDPVTLTACP